MHAQASTPTLPCNFVQRMMPTIRRIANQTARRLPRHIRVDDLVGAGCEGLVAALSRFDPARADGFESYAEVRIRGAMVDELRASDPLSRDQRMRAKRISAATQALCGRLGRAPAADEIAAELRVPLETYWEWISATAVDTKGGAGSGDELDSTAAIGSTRFDGPDESLLRKELVRSVNAAIADLPERMRQVLELHYVEGLTLREIGEKLGVTESRICQIQTEAVRRIRTELGL